MARFGVLVLRKAADGVMNGVIIGIPLNGRKYLGVTGGSSCLPRFGRCVFSVFVFSVLLIFVRGVMELNFLGSDMVVISASLG